MFCRAIWYLSISSACFFGGAVGDAADLGLVSFNHHGRSYVGMSLARDVSTWLILSNDGQLHYLDSEAEFRDVRSMKGEFVPASTMELRDSLIREFGPTFEVVVTRNFLVVQPRDRGKKWPETFDQLHRQFTGQMRSLGVNVRKGKFPMIAIVMPDLAALHQELASQDVPNNMFGGNVAGIYIANSNRVYTHDSGNDASTLPILRHEAAHQSAFNSNVHSRLNKTPKWITEGLGMMMEPAAMTDGRSSTVLQRSNAEALAKLGKRYRETPGLIESDVSRLIANVVMFEASTEIDAAYCISWLMMFYLSERRPTVFAKLLNHTATRAPFAEYPTSERTRDLEAISGLTPRAFAVELHRYTSGK